MTSIQEQQDQLEASLARADAMLRLLTSTNDIDAQTLQTVALDVADHVQEARQLCQALAQRKGPALSGQPLDLSCLSVGFVQRPPVAL